MRHIIVSLIIIGFYSLLCYILAPQVHSFVLANQQLALMVVSSLITIIITSFWFAIVALAVGWLIKEAFKSVFWF